MLLKLSIDSSTKECSFFKTDVMEMFNIENIPFLSNFSPGKNKLFNQDIFNYENDTNSIKIYDSSTRNSQHLPGILKIDKTFGKFKNKLLYRCIPDDKRLPHFLIYYNMLDIFQIVQNLVIYMTNIAIGLLANINIIFFVSLVPTS